jgi:glycosyltransferase involved in cell wall biosynthesis
MSYLEMDDIIYQIQKFGGASTYWNEISKELVNIIPGDIAHTSSSKYARFFSPKSNAKIFHSSHFRVSSSKGVMNVTTIHDLIYEKRLCNGLGKVLNLYERRRSVKQADAIICISESTRSDLYDYYGDFLKSTPVYVIHHGCSRFIRVNDEILTISDDSTNPGIKLGKFYLFVGGRSGYKNFHFLLKSFFMGNFKGQDMSLVCTGVKFNENEKKLIASMNLVKHVVDIGIVSNEQMAQLYREARALVYPSTYEGFGLPPLEAMAAGCPVICCRASSIPEIVGNGGVIIEPYAEDELIAAMNLTLNPIERDRLIQSGYKRSALFDWQKTALEHSNVYKSLVSF